MLICPTTFRFVADSFCGLGAIDESNLDRPCGVADCGCAGGDRFAATLGAPRREVEAGEHASAEDEAEEGQRRNEAVASTHRPESRRV